MQTSQSATQQISTTRPAADDVPVIRAATENDLAGITNLVAQMTERPAAVIRDRIERLAFPPWSRGEPDFGCVLDAGGEVEGFIGWTTVTREVRGEEHQFRNLTTWFVRESQRKSSMNLARRALSLKGATYTALTSTETAARVWRYFDFQTFDEHLRVVYPVPSLRGPRIAIFDERAENPLAEPLRRISTDHQETHCVQACLEYAGEQCLLIGLRKKRWPLSHVRVLYASNRAFFAQHIRDVAAGLCRQWGVGSLRVESRLIGQPRFSKLRKMRSPQLFRSERLTADDVDSLYSEVVLMGL